MNKAPSRWFAESETQVQFFDLDPMEIVWHGHYVKYLEIVRGVLLEAIDYNYPQMKASGYVWPVIDLHLRYIAPAAFTQRLKLRAEIVEWENEWMVVEDSQGNGTNHNRGIKNQLIRIDDDRGDRQLLHGSLIVKQTVTFRK